MIVELLQNLVKSATEFLKYFLKIASEHQVGGGGIVESVKY